MLEKIVENGARLSDFGGGLFVLGELVEEGAQGRGDAHDVGVDVVEPFELESGLFANCVLVRVELRESALNLLRIVLMERDGLGGWWRHHARRVGMTRRSLVMHVRHADGCHSRWSILLRRTSARHSSRWWLRWRSAYHATIIRIVHHLCLIFSVRFLFYFFVFFVFQSFLFN